MASGNGTIQCQCGAKLRVPPNAAGRRIRCPKCEYRIQIPADGVVSQSVNASQPTAAASAPARPKPATPPPPPPPPVHEEEDSLLSDFMQAESGADVAAGPSLEDHQIACPSCKAPIAKTATQCLMCGWEKGQEATKPAADPGTKTAARKLAVGGGKFALGCALSAAGALLGAGIWYGVAVAAHVEIGYIAWAVGLFSGFGMLWGYGKQDFVAALVATLMALGGIFAAKWMIYDNFYGSLDNYTDTTRVIASHWADRKCTDPCERRGMPEWADECLEECDETDEDLFEMADKPFKERHQELEHWATEVRWLDPEYARVVLAHYYANEARAEEESDEEEEWDEQAQIAKYRAQYDVAMAKVDALSDEQRLSEAQQAEMEKQEQYAQFAASMSEFTKEFTGGFFKAMFGPIDALFVLFALGTALKIGGGQDD